MSNAAVTSTMRSAGWNVHFLATRASFHFAGIFQVPAIDGTTFRDVLDEMRLCFEFPGVELAEEGDSEVDLASALAFGFAGVANPAPETDTSTFPSFVTGDDMFQAVPSLAAEDVTDPPITKWHLVRHKPCDLPPNAPLTAHLKAKCAEHLPQPIRRQDARYLPPKKASPDPRFAQMPLRKTARATRRASQSPSKRSASGSVPPNKDNDAANDENVAEMVTPPNMIIDPDVARQTVASFRQSCLVTANRCAVSGKGKSWCLSPAVGPALQACHIVPQQHYHLYPSPNADDESEPADGARRLREAWQETWSPKNAILLLSHLHELFDSRLISIHPDTLRIRAFVPYDVITEYHGRQARIPGVVDREALRHHYEMCCIENMAAQMPLLEPVILSGSGSNTSGLKSPLSSRPDLSDFISPAPSRGGGQDDTSGRNNPSGDPSKRARSTQDQPGATDLCERKKRPIEDQEGQEYAATVEDVWNETQHEHKRRRMDACESEPSSAIESDEEVDDNYWGERQQWEGHITRWNHRQFLADVNWELRRRAPRGWTP